MSRTLHRVYRLGHALLLRSKRHRGQPMRVAHVNVLDVVEGPCPLLDERPARRSRASQPRRRAMRWPVLRLGAAYSMSDQLGAPSPRTMHLTADCCPQLALHIS